VAADRLHHQVRRRSVLLPTPHEGAQRPVRPGDQQDGPCDTRERPVRPDGRVHVLDGPYRVVVRAQQLAEPDVCEVPALARDAEQACLVARSRERRVEAELQVGELEARELLAVDR
jgi:hypothetical protein